MFAHSISRAMDKIVYARVFLGQNRVCLCMWFYVREGHVTSGSTSENGEFFALRRAYGPFDTSSNIYIYYI